MADRLRLTVLASCAPVASPCLPGLNTRSIIFNAAPFAVSRCRVTLGKPGPRRLPALPPRPTARFIEDNTALCYIRRLHCHADCPGCPAGRATARGAAIIAPACRHPACQPLKLRLELEWAGYNQMGSIGMFNKRAIELTATRSSLQIYSSDKKNLGSCRADPSGRMLRLQTRQHSIFSRLL